MSSPELSVTIGAMVDRLFELRERKTEISNQAKKVEADFKALQIELLEILQAQDIQSAKGEKATASVTMALYPTIVDESFFDWAVKNKRYEFLRRQVNVGPVKEMMENENKLPPGTDAHTEAKLNLRRR